MAAYARIVQTHA